MQEQKKKLRTEIKTLLKNMSDEDKKIQSAMIWKQLEHLPEFQSAKVVLLYWSLPDEVDTHQFVNKWATSKTILLPAVVGDNLVLRKYTGSVCLCTGKFNVCEPVSDQNDFSDYSTIDIVIIPGQAFDKNNNRLGRGKAYYDKLLPFFDKTLKVGICFSCQLADNIPLDPWDKKMDIVLFPC